MLLILLLVIALVAALIVGSIARSWSSAAREQLSAVASACGIDPDELEARVHEGESMESVAAEHGVDAKQVVQGILSSLKGEEGGH